MRVILTGCEYAGKSTLASALHAWGQSHGFQYHMDDHFTVPDNSLRTDEERLRPGRPADDEGALPALPDLLPPAPPTGL